MIFIQQFQVAAEQRRLKEQTGKPSMYQYTNGFEQLRAELMDEHDLEGELSCMRAIRNNITIVLFPSRSPELNPVENVWQFLRDNWLSNRVFTSCDDIVDHCCEAWNKLVDRPWTIMSIGMRDWAYRS
jgi:DDE superfamily endonuclease